MKEWDSINGAMNKLTKQEGIEQLVNQKKKENSTNGVPEYLNSMNIAERKSISMNRQYNENISSESLLKK